VNHCPIDLPGEVAFTNGAPLIHFACDADWRAGALAAFRRGDHSIDALIGESILGCRVVRRPIKEKKRRGGDTAYRHRQEVT
jgi:hypothetical protein